MGKINKGGRKKKKKGRRKALSPFFPRRRRHLVVRHDGGEKSKRKLLSFFFVRRPDEKKKEEGGEKVPPILSSGHCFSNTQTRIGEKEKEIIWVIKDPSVCESGHTRKQDAAAAKAMAATVIFESKSGMEQKIELGMSWGAPFRTGNGRREKEFFFLSSPGLAYNRFSVLKSEPERWRRQKPVAATLAQKVLMRGTIGRQGF